jgi:hypothetical protein
VRGNRECGWPRQSGSEQSWHTRARILSARAPNTCSISGGPAPSWLIISPAWPEQMIAIWCGSDAPSRPLGAPGPRNRRMMSPTCEGSRRRLRPRSVFRYLWHPRLNPVGRTSTDVLFPQPYRHQTTSGRACRLGRWRRCCSSVGGPSAGSAYPRHGLVESPPTQERPRPKICSATADTAHSIHSSCVQPRPSTRAR